MDRFVKPRPSDQSDLAEGKDDDAMHDDGDGDDGDEEEEDGGGAGYWDPEAEFEF
jgi:hypothetical protein